MAVKTGRIWAFIVNPGRKWEESRYAARPAGASPGESTCRGPKQSPGLGSQETAELTHSLGLQVFGQMGSSAWRILTPWKKPGSGLSSTPLLAE